MPVHRYYTAPELAKLIGVSRQTVIAYAQKGVAPAHLKLPDGQLRFHSSDVETWLRGRNMPNLMQLERKQRLGINVLP